MAEIPELRPPKKDNSMEEAFLKAQKGTDGFAKKLTDIINEQDQKPMPISHKSGDSKAAIAKSACDAVNRRHQETRELIDRRMQDYLMENGGRVDLWPDSLPGTAPCPQRSGRAGTARPLPDSPERYC